MALPGPCWRQVQPKLRLPVVISAIRITAKATKRIPHGLSRLTLLHMDAQFETMTAQQRSQDGAQDRPLDAMLEPFWKEYPREQNCIVG